MFRFDFIAQSLSSSRMNDYGGFLFSGYLLRSTKSGAELRNSIARVSGAWMATVKPQGWVHASLEMAFLGSAVRKWSQLDNQILFLSSR